MTVRTLTLLIPFFFLQGCDTSGEEFDTSGFETVDNSELASFFNAYGYYGEDVMFGETTVSGIWLLYNTSSDDIIVASFQESGNVTILGGSTNTYGVAQSGLSINISTGETIVITTSEIYKQVDEIDCYRVKIYGDTTSTADMCPDH